MAGNRPGPPSVCACTRSPSVTPAPSCSGASSGTEGGSGSCARRAPTSVSRRSSGTGFVRISGKAFDGGSRSSATKASGSSASPASPGTDPPRCARARFWASSSALSAFSRSFREGSSGSLPGAPSFPWTGISRPAPCSRTSSRPASPCRVRRAFPSRAFRRSSRDGDAPPRNAGAASDRRPGRCGDATAADRDCSGPSPPPRPGPWASSSGNPGPPAVASATSMPQSEGDPSAGAASGAPDAAFPLLRPPAHRTIRVAQ